MAPPPNLFTLIVLAGIFLGYALWRFFNRPDDESVYDYLQYRNAPDEPPPPTRSCPICRLPMRNATIELNCSHTFHNECYTIWRRVMLAGDPDASICPFCP